MTNLAVFDFDWTIVEGDSDELIYSKLKEDSQIDLDVRDWAGVMSKVFEKVHLAGFQQSDILESIASMRATPGMVELIATLADQGWDVLVLTNANTVFVNHWLKTHGLLDAVTGVITNPAFWQDNRLFIEPCMRQNSCRRCPTNLCKSLALAQWCKEREYHTVVYSGDGRNDFCPSINLPSNGIIFPRMGYPLDDLIKESLATPEHQIKAKVVPWTDAFRILQELFPNIEPILS